MLTMTSSSPALPRSIMLSIVSCLLLCSRISNRASLFSNNSAPRKNNGRGRSNASSDLSRRTRRKCLKNANKMYLRRRRLSESARRSRKRKSTIRVSSTDSVNRCVKINSRTTLTRRRQRRRSLQPTRTTTTLMFCT